MIKRTLLVLATAVTLLGLYPTSRAAAAPGEIVTVPLAGTYEQAVDRFKKGVTGSGMMVLAEVDHGKILSMTGLHLKSHLFLVGNPNVGKQLFSADHRVALLVPLRVAIFEDDGKTYLSYEKPSASLERLGNPGLAKTAAMLDGKFQQMGQGLMK